MKYLLILAILLSTYVCSAGTTADFIGYSESDVDSELYTDGELSFTDTSPEIEFTKPTLHVTIDDDTVFEYKGEEYALKELIRYIIWQEDR